MILKIISRYFESFCSWLNFPDLPLRNNFLFCSVTKVLKNTSNILHIIVIYLCIHEKLFPGDCVTKLPVTIGYSKRCCEWRNLTSSSIWSPPSHTGWVNFDWPKNKIFVIYSCIKANVTSGVMMARVHTTI